MYNDMVSFVQSSLGSSKVVKLVVVQQLSKCVSTLRDALWYIDGMHDTLNERSHKMKTR